MVILTVERSPPQILVELVVSMIWILEVAEARKRRLEHNDTEEKKICGTR